MTTLITALLWPFKMLAIGLLWLWMVLATGWQAFDDWMWRRNQRP